MNFYDFCTSFNDKYLQRELDRCLSAEFPQIHPLTSVEWVDTRGSMRIDIAIQSPESAYPQYQWVKTPKKGLKMLLLRLWGRLFSDSLYELTFTEERVIAPYTAVMPRLHLLLKGFDVKPGYSDEIVRFYAGYNPIDDILYIEEN